MVEQEYIKVSVNDIIRVCMIAKNNKENSLLIQRLSNLFVNAEQSEVSILKESEEAKYLLKCNPALLLQNDITLESLSLAFTRLYFGKNNKELLKRIEKYYRQFIDNIKSNDDNTSLKQEIVLDTEAYTMIQQFSSYEGYEEHIVGKKVKQKEKIIPKQELKGKAIVE